MQMRWCLSTWCYYLRASVDGLPEPGRGRLPPHLQGSSDRDKVKDYRQ